MITDSADEVCYVMLSDILYIACFPSRSFFLRLFTSFCLSTQSFSTSFFYPFLAAFTATLSHLSASLPSLLTGDFFFPSLFRFIALSSAALPFSSLIALPYVLSLLFYSSLFICSRSVVVFRSWHLLLVYTFFFSLALSFAQSYTLPFTSFSIYSIFFSLVYLFLTRTFSSFTLTY